MSRSDFLHAVPVEGQDLQTLTAVVTWIECLPIDKKVAVLLAMFCSAIEQESHVNNRGSDLFFNLMASVFYTNHSFYGIPHAATKVLVDKAFSVVVAQTKPQETPSGTRH